MTKTLLLILIFCVAIRAHAQEEPTDSLLNLLNHHAQDDTTRLNTLIALANEFAETDTEKGIAFANEAITLAKKLNLPSKTGKAYFTKALVYVNDDDNKNALNALSYAVVSFTEAKDSFNLARCYFGKGLAYFNLSSYDTAIQWHLKALSIYQALHEQKRVANCLNSIGANYRNLSNYSKAIDYYLQALSIYELTKSNNETAMTLANVGMIYKDIEDFKHALQYYERSITIYKQSGDQQGIAKALTNMGIAYDGLNNTSKALDLFTEALKLNDSLGLKTEISSNLNSIGEIYFDRKDYANALPYFKKALSIATQLENKRSIGIISSYLGMLYLNCPDSLLKKEGIPVSERYAKSLDLEKTGLQLAKESGSVYDQSISMLHMSAVYESLHDYKNSLEYYKQYGLLKDSILNEKNTNEITRKEMQYEYEKKEALSKADNEKDQALAAAEINRQRVIKNSVMGGTVILFLAAISSFILYKRRRDAEILKTAAEFKVQVSETEMKALRAQMNPHFIFNSLNSISDYISKNDIPSADLYLSKFAKIMRMILEHSEQKEVTLADDLNALELYMQLEAARMNNKFTYEIKVTDDINAEETFIPPLLLQPFVENSIWHGISKKQGNGKITITIAKENNMLNCIVEDDGVGRAATANEIQPGKKSLGMKITMTRIEILNKQKRSNAAINLTDLAQGTKVEIKLPLELSF
jgi:tetratricopeptide (TPR) repeat protein